MKTAQEIVKWVDDAIASVLTDALEDSNKQEKTEENAKEYLTLVGAIGGSLIKTGITIMAKAGIPRDLMQGAINFAIEEAYRE